MEILLTSSVGFGSNELSAFDDALCNAGVSNFNLIYLSSVIPPKSIVKEVERYMAPKEDFGKRLYIVRAIETTSTPGESIAAGIGWYQLDDGRGFFVEHHARGMKESVSTVQKNIFLSLEEICKRRGLKFFEKKVHFKLNHTLCTDGPTSVMVLAVYKSESWEY